MDCLLKRGCDNDVMDTENLGRRGEKAGVMSYLTVIVVIQVLCVCIENAPRAIDDDRGLLFLGPTERYKVGVALEHLPCHNSDQGQRGNLGIAPSSGLASGDAGVDDGVLAV